jgi:hypothetical protein
MVTEIATISSLMFCFKSTVVLGFFSNTLLLRNPQRKMYSIQILSGRSIQFKYSEEEVFNSNPRRKKYSIQILRGRNIQFKSSEEKVFNSDPQRKKYSIQILRGRSIQ